MTKVYQITPRGTVERFAEAIANLNAPGDYVLVVRGVPRAIIMSCPDGCGDTVTVNLDRRTGPAWRKYEREQQLTIYPSIWRETGCEAHFIVRNGRIIWCGRESREKELPIDEALTAKVLTHLSDQFYVHYEFLADKLDELPWDVYWACNELVHRRLATEGNRGAYRRVSKKYPDAPNQRIDLLA